MHIIKRTTHRFTGGLTSELPQNLTNLPQPHTGQRAWWANGNYHIEDTATETLTTYLIQNQGAEQWGYTPSPQ